MSKGIEFIQKKIMSLEQLLQWRRTCKKRGESVVFTNGCYDILHQGHVEYLIKSAEKGNRLIVAVNSDDSIRLLNKDVNRPINDQNARSFLIASLSFVDAVVIFSEKTPEDLIKLSLPDVLTKGADYDISIRDPKNPRYIVGSDVVLANGGQVETIALLDGFSTTAIIEKIRKNN